MIDITNIIPEQMPNTIVINPRWKFKARSALTDQSKQTEWSKEDLINSNITDYINNKATVLLWVTPTALSIGRHLEVCEGWKVYPQTVAVWNNTNCYGGGYTFDDSAYFLVKCYTKKTSGSKNSFKGTTPRVIQSDAVGAGVSYGSDIYAWIETMGNPPYCQIFKRRETEKYIPKDWYLVDPDRPKPLTKDELPNG